jgi:hypothetical protein
MDLPKQLQVVLRAIAKISLISEDSSGADQTGQKI